MFWCGLIILISFFLCSNRAEISSGRIKADDEPHMVSWHVLEGITEPFESEQHQDIPAWKQMKNSADQKAAGQMIQQALHEYGQLLRHPYMFGDMPMVEKYDIFLSMSKLLKIMGFYQRAELLLYEAMSYTTNPFEAHLQLGLLFLDKEDLEKAKMHLKNCLFFQENDVHILVHLTVILISEGKIFEAKYFLSRIIGGLESRVNKLSFLLNKQDKQLSDISKDVVNYKVLSNWLEELIVKVFYGEFRITPSSTFDMLKLFSNLYTWLSAGEMSGRFIFDLGQSLYEGGRPRVGQLMMKRGHETADDATEGSVSYEVVRMRLAMDQPVVPDSLVELVDSYFNMTIFLSNTSSHYSTIELENIMDMYWSLPLLAFSGLPVMPVVKELLWRFNASIFADGFMPWYPVNATLDNLLDKHPFHLSQPFDSQLNPSASAVEAEEDCEEADDEESCLKRNKKRATATAAAAKTTASGAPLTLPVRIEVGILGGHFNHHLVGQMTLLRLLKTLRAPGWRDLIRVTLLALPLLSDGVTRQIAAKVDRIVNLPLDNQDAQKVLGSLHLDVLLFPDWQPFPDQQSIVFVTQRIAPVQVCYYVVGGSCVSSTVDYYLLPEELGATYQAALPATDAQATVDARTGVIVTNSTISKGVRAAESSSQAEEPTPGGVKRRRLRPLWREPYAEQVVLVDWPIITPELIVEIASQTLPAPVEASTAKAAPGSKTNDSKQAGVTAKESSPTLEQTAEGSLNAMMFNPLEIEGKVFFEGQPVAVLPLDPTHIHPLMDNLLFKIMRAVPNLHLIVALPETFFAHVPDAKHKMSWARKLVRRLWARGGNLFHRIRLLPAPMNDHRLLQLLQQADMVLDSFPVGGSFHLMSLALSVGTPVLALQNGVALKSTKDELRELRTFVSAALQKAPPGVVATQNRSDLYKSNPLTQVILRDDVPWNPSVSSLCGFYERAGLSGYFVANSTASYYHLAVKLALNREYAYGLRVKLLEIVDKVGGRNTFDRFTTVNPYSDGSEQPKPGAAETVVAAATEKREAAVSLCQSGQGCIEDVGRFIVSVGAPFAKSRASAAAALAAAAATGKKKPARTKASPQELNDRSKEYFDLGKFGIKK